MNNFNRIPAELRVFVQWIVWRYETRNAIEKPTKVPYNPATGRHASVTDPTTWTTFAQAVAACEANIGYDGIGFVFTVNDPFCGVDFDETDPNFPEDHERQVAIHGLLNTYSEYSPSGKGIHAIGIATVPLGRKRSNIEIYSSERYFTFTGNVFNDAPIVDMQKQIDNVWAQMGTSAQPVYFAGELSEKHGDQEIWDRASKAQNGDLFLRLWNGDWSGYRPNNSGTASSEADFALIDIIAFYTRNRMQIQRMFLASALGKRDKYQATTASRQARLIGYMINKSFDNMLPDVDLSAVTDMVNAALAGQGAQQDAFPSSAYTGSPDANVAQPAGALGVVPIPLPVNPPHRATLEAPGADPYTFDGFRLDLWRNSPPPGLMGEIGRWIFEQSPSPTYELALAGAIGFMAGLCGRAYNVSNTGLNLYVMALAETGTGKEAIASGIDKLIAATAVNAPSIRNMVGPGRIASGQALLKHLADKPCVLSVVGEFGIKLKQITNANANDAESSLLSVLLDLYTKSGKGRSMMPMIYSDKKNNTDEIFSPAFTMLGETVPSVFYQALDERAISSGLLPRFINIEYEGNVPEFNYNHSSVVPNEWLINSLDALYMDIAKRMGVGAVVDVEYDRDAEEHLRFLQAYGRKRVDGSKQDVIRHLWNRFHLKVLKLSALVAVGINMYTPVITRPMVDWSASLIMNDIVRLTHKFERGEIGMQHDTARTQETELKRVWHDYFRRDFTELLTYQVKPKMHADRVITKYYLSTRLKRTAPFRSSDHNGKVDFKTDLDRLLKHLETTGVIQQLPRQQILASYGGGGECYALVNMHWLTE